MRLLHTSDWHLGRSLLGVSMLEHQRTFVDWLVEAVEARRIDAVLIAGDVFDRALPPVEAVAIFESALLRLARHCPVLLIPGNHDSAVRLGFAGPLLALGQVHVRASLDSVGDPLVVTDGEVTARIYGIPYLEPRLAADRLGVEPSHEAVLSAAMTLVRADADAHPNDVTVVVAHAFVAGGTASDSERDVSIGGIGSASVEVFAGADLIALGHLHRPQRLAGQVHAAYSGSPLPYSFSEEGYAKQVSIIEVDALGAVSVDSLPVPQPRELRTIEGDLENLLVEADLEDAVECWVRAIVTDARRPEEPMRRLRERFPHVLELVFMPKVDGVALSLDERRIDPRAADPIAVCAGFVAHVTGTDATEAECALLAASVDDVTRGQVTA